MEHYDISSPTPPRRPGRYWWVWLVVPVLAFAEAPIRQIGVHVHEITVRPWGPGLTVGYSISALVLLGLVFRSGMSFQRWRLSRRS